jgi:hypothetical protein
MTTRDFRLRGKFWRQSRDEILLAKWKLIILSQFVEDVDKRLEFGVEFRIKINSNK